MLAEIISIGDEMTSGARLDTNSQWLSLRLEELGIEVGYHTTVRDDLAANVAVFRAAAQRADVVIATGGLGPTADDLTRESLATLIGKPLVLDQAALDHIKQLFSRRARPMPPRNEIQAMFPEGAEVIPNPAGTAPGILLDVPRSGRTSCRLIALPGVPAEMREMWDATCAGKIQQQYTAASVIRRRAIKCFGVGESDLELMLGDMIRRGRQPQVGITVHGATITLRIAAAGRTAEECERQIAATVNEIHDKLGPLVFGEGDDELEHAVVRLLRARQQSVATAEWSSGGLVADWLAAVDASDGWFPGGLVVRTRDAARGMLAREGGGELADEPAALTEQLAIDARVSFATDWAIAVGPLADQEANGKLMPHLFVSVVGPSGTVNRQFPYVGHPDILKSRGAKQALNTLRLAMLESK